ncbi:hypothetical protein OKW21_004528 [Catalinimonas alkaloidigena]|uniref:SusD/RagB family nutrient-binding outer membrane lipoprotein n=1 Tax=Catalinimonas alkaloidigena TaxID=1075417 RepID=UPI002405E62E|nr:SusD/RagB family nutrient-binding outer membrane lipoprotein [Catalinimonas alkaloidigena]MDF9799265.1 hypothetical protein [Catalinimonas alkaloidigena]
MKSGIYTRIKKTVFILIIGSIIVSACTDGFEEMNTNPNNPTLVTQDILLPFAIESAIDRYWGHQNRFERLGLDGGVCWVQYFARRNFPSEGDNYEVPITVTSSIWQGFFNDVMLNFERIRKLSVEGGEFTNSNYEGVALVMRSWVFSLLTDIYGPIPYTEALKGTLDGGDPNYIPTYDSGEEVYSGILADLEQANDLLDPDGPAIFGDIMFSGDILKWKKMANSLRLRLLNRQAEHVDNSGSQMQAILADPAAYPVFTSNDDYAQLIHSSARPSNNEWHEVMVQGGRTDWRVSETLVSRLKERNDPRLTVYAQPVGGEGDIYTGLPNALPESIALGLGGETSFPGTKFMEAGTPSVIMSYAELMFVLAEAAFDGDVSGDPQSYFVEGIKASFEQHGVEMPAEYIESIGVLTKEKIMMQKWIALFGQGIEAWAELRRTGMPSLPAPDPRAVFRNNGVVPTRLEYPPSEYSLNSENVREAIQLLDGEDNMQTELWWVEN